MEQTKSITTDAEQNAVVVDGSLMEGGGQIVRNATAFSALLRKPITVHNVRGKRSSPGLKPQHAAGLQLAAEICSAKTKGVACKSRVFTYIPGEIHSGDYASDPGTAGSITLLLQIALPCLLFAKPVDVHDVVGDHSRPQVPVSHLRLRGGSNVTNAPQVEYTQHILFPFIQRHFNLPPDRLSLTTLKRGLWPRGGGSVSVTVPSLTAGQSLPAVDVTLRGDVLSVKGVAFGGQMSGESVVEVRDAALTTLRDYDLTRFASRSLLPPSVDIALDQSAGNHSGFGIVLWAETSTGCLIGGSSLGQKGKTATACGSHAAHELIRNLAHGGCIDEYMQDQIIIFLALASGKSMVRTGPLTVHTRTAMWIAETMCGAKFESRVSDKGSFIICCEGIGLKA